MKQVLLDPRTGRVSLTEVPAPKVEPTRVLVRTRVSALSPGTERMLLGLASAGFVGKARARPEAARQAFEVIRREGPRSALWKAQARLKHPFPLGYSLAGTVMESGLRVAGGSPPGTRVACSGATQAVHAELVSVPALLTVPIPDSVPSDVAAFTGIGAIAVHAARLARVELGSRVAVLGLGLLGQLASQILAAGGMRVFGLDPDRWRCELASRVADGQVFTDADNATKTCQANGGVDAIIVSASTADTRILDAAIDMARDRGTIVVVGAVPVTVDRDRMYRKELSLVVARSLGPGRYEPAYEEKGVDLPIGHVRWSEGRNMEAFLDLAARGRLDVASLITHRFAFDDAERAYELIESNEEPFMGVALQIPESEVEFQPSLAIERSRARPTDRPGIGVIGAGLFARGTLLPRLRRLPVDLVAVATATGASAMGTARRFGFARATTDALSVIDDDDVDAVIIATQHDQHAELAARALANGRAVYVEKPLALSRAELTDVCMAWSHSISLLSVGHNRRFAPLLQQLKAFCAGRGPFMATYAVDAARLPSDSWVLDAELGGGVILAEGSHFVDALAAVIGRPPTTASATQLSETSYEASLRFEDGSLATIHYSTLAGGAGPKEVLTVLGTGIHARLDDFRSLNVWGGSGRKRIVRRRQDKGHAASLRAWVDAVRSGGEQPVSILDVLASCEATICLHESAHLGELLRVDLGPYLQALSAPPTA